MKLDLKKRWTAVKARATAYRVRLKRGLTDFLSVLVIVLEAGYRALILATTIAGGPIAFYLAYRLLAPIDVTDQVRKDYSAFFQTAAQVVVGLLVAMAIETRLARSRNFVGVGTALFLGSAYAALAEVAALAALSPNLENHVIREAYAATFAGGAMALFVVLVIATRRGPFVVTERTHVESTSQ